MEFIEYNKGVYIKPVSDFAEKSMNVSEIRTRADRFTEIQML
ncbi:MAG: hypothetical protein R2941_15745 [Desulfobacterales bacterium]